MNIFDGLITSDLQDIFNQGVDELIKSCSGLVLRCRLFYPATDYTVSDSSNLIGQQSFHHVTGAPIPSTSFANPAEAASNINPVETTED